MLIVEQARGGTQRDEVIAGLRAAILTRVGDLSAEPQIRNTDSRHRWSKSNRSCRVQSDSELLLAIRNYHRVMKLKCRLTATLR